MATGKVRLPDAMSATRALHNAATLRAYAAANGHPSHRAERRKYRCRLCNGWHMTSQEQAIHIMEDPADLGSSPHRRNTFLQMGLLR